MKKLNKDLFNKSFSHIYIEKQAKNHPNTQKIISHFANSNIIEINHYKDVFCRSHQNFYLQKQSPNLILAIKTDNLIYKGARFCNDFGNDHFYYTSSIMNCIYNCEYCYLQGMYPSANIVIFVNIEDIFHKVEEILNKHSMYLCISYDTDILALEQITQYTSKWIDFCKKHDNLKIEIRTKSSNFYAIKDITPTDNVILAWTLSPSLISQKYEDKTPSLRSRLYSINQAIKNNWNVRICFDPILYLRDFKENYKDLIDTTFSTIPPNKILDLSIGVFRVSSEYLKTMRKNRFDSIILNYPFMCKNKEYTYDENLSKEMISYVYNLSKKYIDEDKIYIS